jgi:hypothetical protein
MYNFRVYWISLCMFRTVFSSVVRGSRHYTQHQVYVIQVSWLLASRHGIELQFHLLPTSMQSTNLYDINLMLCVKPWIPDDGWKDCPKHAEWYSLTLKIVHLVGFATMHGPMNVKNSGNYVFQFWRSFPINANHSWIADLHLFINAEPPPPYPVVFQQKVSTELWQVRNISVLMS